MRPLPAVLLVILLLGPVWPLPGADAQGGTLRIDGDASIPAGTPGSGTAQDPYVLTPGVISAAGSHGIQISNTQKHLVLRNAHVGSGGNAWDGIRLVNVRNVTIEGATVESSRHGILVQSSRDVVVTGSTVKSCQVGVLLESSTGVTLHQNRLTVNEQDVRFRFASGNVLTNNNLSVATGQYGLYFEDVPSYDNRIGTTNVVNAIPVQWHSGLRGTATQPILVTQAVVDLKGMTNVAQVAVHNSSHVRLVAPVAKAGAATGLLVQASDNVTLAQPSLEGNVLFGARVEESRDVRLEDPFVRANGGGISLLHARVAIAGGNLTGNLGDGLRVQQGILEVRNLSLHANTGQGISARGLDRLVVADSNLTANGGTALAVANVASVQAARNRLEGTGAGTGLHVQASPGVYHDNLVAGHSPAIRLSAVEGAHFDRNHVTIAAGQTGFHFDGPDSYATRVNTTNLVNGVGVRWYVNLTGTATEPVVIPPVAVDVKGITNVAQVMVYRSQNVTLQSPLASSGAGAGILLYESRRVHLSEPRAQGNAQQGIWILRSEDATVAGGRAEDNGAAGVHLVASPAPSVENLVARRNGAEGVLAESSPGGTHRGNALLLNGGAGIRLSGGTSAASTVENGLFERNGAGGLVIQGAAVGAIRGNRLGDNGPVGVHLSSAPPGALVESNLVAAHAAGIRLSASRGHQLHDNNVTFRAGQTAFMLDDETSYDNLAPPSNVANGVPLRWYANMAGNATSPIVLSDLDVEIEGITNVAQILLLNVTNLTIRDSVASNGTHRGIFALRSQNVTFERVLVRDVKLQGLHVRETPGTDADNVTVERPGQQGILVESSPRFNLTGSGVSNATANGVQVEGSPAARVANVTLRDGNALGLGVSSGGGALTVVENVTARSNKGGGLSLSSTALRLVDSLVRDNGPHGVLLASTPAGASLARNEIGNQTRNVHLAATRDVTLRDHVVDVRKDQFGLYFEDEASFRNDVDASNRVNNVSIRWHVNVTGTPEAPARLGNALVEVRGITNVAQFMLLDSRHVVVENVTVANGTSAGIRVQSSSNVSLRQGSVQGSSGEGLLLKDGAHLSLWNVTSRDNVEHGVRAVNVFEAFLQRVHVVNNSADGLRVEGSPRPRLANLTASQNGAAGVRLSASADALVEDSVAEANGAEGLLATGSTTRVEVRRNVVAANARDGLRVETGTMVQVEANEAHLNRGAGIRLASLGSGANVRGNLLAGNGQGIRISATGFATLQENRVNISAGQTGLHFDDEASYNNEIDPSNLVNGIPVRWLTRLSGTESSPVNVSGLRVELAGITNVAQVMVYQSAYVRLHDVVATNGTARGILLYRSSAIDVARGNLSGSDVGLHLHETQSSRVRDLGADPVRVGALLTSSNHNDIARVNLRGAQAGVQLDAASRGNRIERIDVVDAPARGVQDPTVSGLRGSNLVADAGGEKRVRANRSVDLADATGAARFDSERVVEQVWTFGDGQSRTSTASAPLQPTHVYEHPGTYAVNYTIRTLDGQVLSDSVRVHVLPPLSEPLHVRVNVGDRNATLVWSPPLHEGGAAIVGYRIWRGTDEASMALVAEVGTVTHHLDARDLRNGVPYVWKVSAVNADEEGPRSAPAIAIPAARPGVPATLEAKGRPGAVALVWSPPTDTGGLPIRAYFIYRAEPGGPLQLVADVGNLTGYNDTGLANGRTYTYAVAALNPLGQGPASANATATPLAPPGPPRSLRALPGDTTVTLGWSAPLENGGRPVEAYRVYRGATASTMAFVAEVTGTTYQDTGLANGRIYHYSVGARNSVGEGNASAPASAMPETVDVVAPLILEKTPEEGAFLREPRPMIAVRWIDNVGVLMDRVDLQLDNRSLMADATLIEGNVSYLPSENLPPGHHEVFVALRDAAGNQARETWRFRILAEEEAVPVVRYVGFVLEPNETLPLKPVVARVELENEGFAAAVDVVRLLLGERELANATFELAPGGKTSLLLEFPAPRAGTHELRVGDLNATLRVRAPVLAPTNVSGAQAEEPEEAPEAGLPAPGVAPILGLLALVAVFTRRRGPKNGSRSNVG